MKNQEKIKYFEYFVHKVYEWQGKADNNDLSILKLMKLLFFTTAVNSTKDKDSILLNNVFNNYVAMPFGHVESAVYSMIKEDKSLMFYELSYSRTKRKEAFCEKSFDEFISSLDQSYILEIDNSIQLLKVKNSALIVYSAFDLVELSHQWYSWKQFFSKEKKISARDSYEISKEVIIDEDKYFETQYF
jgi:uncharacterized phage-associated protein